jgi:hypothetical protein
VDFFSCRDPQRMQGLCAAGVFPAAVALDPGYWLGSKVSMMDSRFPFGPCKMPSWRQRRLRSSQAITEIQLEIGRGMSEKVEADFALRRAHQGPGRTLPRSLLETSSGRRRRRVEGMTPSSADVLARGSA